MVRVAMLSGWHVHARGYAQDALKLGASISCVWDEDASRGAKWAGEMGVPFEPDLNACLARDDVDAVLVNTPTNMHKEVIIQAAQAGKHIFTEKVLAFTLADCDEIAEAVEKANVLFTISLPQRGSAQTLYAKKIMDSGLLGRVTLIRVRNAHDGASSGWLPPHFYDRQQCGGGAMMDLGAHPMYTLSLFLGAPKSVVSMFNETTGHGVEDNAVSVIEFQNGALGISETGFVSKNSPYSLEIYGTEGSLFVGGPEGRVSVYSGKGEVPGFVRPAQLPADAPKPMAAFFDAIQGKAEVLYTLKDARDLTELMEKAYLSDRLGQKVFF